MQAITGLENPNSVQKMKEWLAKHGVEADALDKKAVKELIRNSDNQTVQTALMLRQQLAKSSVKKYQSMQNAVCRDGRARGMFQFYGANRSGRWAGRLIQLQNLPQNHLPDLEQARQYVNDGDYEMLELLYDSVPAVLSELIRTAFIPRPDTNSLSATSLPLKPEYLHTSQGRPGAPGYLQREKISIVLLPARCSACLLKSTALTATFARRERSQNSPSDTADPSAP